MPHQAVTVQQSAITALGQLIWRCGFLPVFPPSSSAAAAHFHWSGRLSIIPLHTSPKQLVRQARASEAELAARGGASAVDSASAASQLRFWKRARRHPGSSCYGCCTWSGKRVFLAICPTSSSQPEPVCLLCPFGFGILVRAVKPPTLASSVLSWFLQLRSQAAECW